MLNTDGSVQREYTPVSAEDLRKATLLIKAAIGWDQQRGDSVTVEHLQFDRMRQFQQEDAMLRREAELLHTLPGGGGSGGVVVRGSRLLVLGAAPPVARRAALRHASGTLERRRARRLDGFARRHAKQDTDAAERGQIGARASADAARALRTWLAEK